MKPDHRFLRLSYPWNLHMFEMPSERYEDWKIQIIFEDRPEYIYKSEYEQYKDNFVEILDKDLLK